jgi:hypothetical protein
MEAMNRLWRSSINRFSMPIFTGRPLFAIGELTVDGAVNYGNTELLGPNYRMAHDPGSHETLRRA